MIFFTGFFSKSPHRALCASDISRAWFSMTGIKLMERLIMIATRFSGINGIGFKNHWTAFFTEEGLVVEEKSTPVIITRKNFRATEIPSSSPCFVMDRS